MGTDIVQDQHEVARSHLAVLRQRHEQFAMTPQIGETQAVDETDIGERHLGEETARPRRRGSRLRRRCGRG